jgi:hypothetical protein
MKTLPELQAQLDAGKVITSIGAGVSFFKLDGDYYKVVGEQVEHLASFSIEDITDYHKPRWYVSEQTTDRYQPLTPKIMAFRTATLTRRGGVASEDGATLMHRIGGIDAIIWTPIER